MQIRIIALVGITVACVGCASSPSVSDEAAAGTVGSASQEDALQMNDAEAMSQALNYTGAATAEESGAKPLCAPTVRDNRAAMDKDCINVVKGVPRNGPHYSNAPTVIHYKYRSLCHNTFTPRCRRGNE